MTDTETRITAREARNLFLSRQMLTERAPDPLSALKQVVAVQTQYAASLPAALIARSAKYPVNWHEKALLSGLIIKTWTLRRTVHTHTPEDHAVILAALGERWRNEHLRWCKMEGRFSDEHFDEIEGRILQALRAGPKTRQELHAQITELATLPWAGWGQDVKGLAYLGAISFANNDGASRFRLYDLPELSLDAEAAACELARIYFRSNGLATSQDFRYWSSMPTAMVRSVMKAIEPELTSISVDGLKGTRYVYGEVQAADHRGVRLLPKFDALALAHGDKSLFFDSRTAKLVFRPAGQIEATVLSDGELVGTWRIKKGSKTGQIAVYPFRTLGPRVIGRIEKEAARMAKGLGLAEITVTVSG